MYFSPADWFEERPVAGPTTVLLHLIKLLKEQEQFVLVLGTNYLVHKYRPRV